MEKLRTRMLAYLREGQLLEPYLAEEITANLIDVIHEWRVDLSQEIPKVDEALPYLTEET